MSSLKREKRPDKNGKLVTRVVLADSAIQTSSSRLPPPSVQQENPRSTSDTTVAAKTTAQYVAYEFLKDAGHSRDDYSHEHFLVYKKLLQQPAEGLAAAEAILRRDDIAGIGTKYLAPALAKGLLTEASRIVSDIVYPNIDNLQAGIHGIVGALRALPDSCATDSYAMREGQEESVLAFLKLECALDRNNVFGKCDEIKDFVIANPDVADRVVRAIDERQTADMEILLPMVEARALSDGVL